MSVPFQLSNPDFLHNQLYINGEWKQSVSGKEFAVQDPGTGKTWISCQDSTPDDVDPAVQAAHTAFKSYSQLNPRKRAELLASWHRLLVSSRDDLAKILVHETGKPLSEAYGELDYGISFTWWCTGEADRIQGSTFTSAAPDRRGLTIKQPIGVSVAMIPWNFPVALVLRKASAALAAGCTMVVKPSPETPITALCLANLATQAGFPRGALNVMTTSTENTPAVSKALCTHPLVKKVSFTGSTRVGKIVAELCARSLTKSTLELGGNCPFIVFDDADLDHAVDQLISLKWRHAGQACITANRVYVQTSVYMEFANRVVDRTRTLVVGHGMGTGTTMGPVTVPRSLDKVEAIASDAIRRGAKLLLGSGRRWTNCETGNPDSCSGYFMDPTILIDMTDDMLLSREEVFGPLLGIYPFTSEAEVTQRANDTTLGLASYVFTENVNRLWRMMESLEAGMIGLVSTSDYSTSKYWHTTDLCYSISYRMLAMHQRQKLLSEVLRKVDGVKKVVKMSLLTST